MSDRDEMKAGDETRDVRRLAVLLLAAAVHAAVLVFLARTPESRVFDEVFYAGECARDSGAEVLRYRDHPPLGFALTCAGVRLLGDTPLGGRIASMLASIATVLVLLSHANAKGYPRRALVTAGLLLAFEPLLLSLGRTGMLDTFLAFFCAASIASFDRSLAGGKAEVRWLVLAGITAGAACAVKWSGALLPLAYLVFYATSQKNPNDIRFDPRVIVGIVVMPVLTFVGLHFVLGFTPTSLLVFVKTKIIHHVAYYPIAILSIGSRAHEWLFLHRPIAFASPAFGAAGYVLVTSSPFAHAAALIFVGHALRDRLRKPFERLVVIFALVQLTAWEFAPRVAFLYYLVTITPFLYVPMAERLARRPRLAAGLVTLHVAYTLYLLPVMRGAPLPESVPLTAYTANPLLGAAFRAGPRTTGSPPGGAP